MYIKTSLLFFFISTFVFAQSQSIALEAANWEFLPQAKHEFKTVEGKKALWLNGTAFVKDSDFGDGVLTVDILATDKRSFAGIVFHQQDGFFEEVYLRLHKSKQVDALQYTPKYHHESNWQLYPEHQAQVAYLDSGWNRLQITIRGNTAQVSVNGSQVLVVPHLKTGLTRGRIGLFGLFGATFTQFTMENTMASAWEVTPAVTDPLLVSDWALSDAFVYDDSEDLHKWLQKEPKQRVKTEASGLLPVSKYVAKSSSGSFDRNREDVVVASIKIESDGQQTQWLDFDYSDKVRVFLNGTEIYRGSESFRTLNPQFMGHLGKGQRQIPLALKKGENNLQVVLIEKANGWGLRAAFKNAQGIRWQP
ncbi:family 16 glycoside hydrolase [Sediminicola luteus]|uniref:3-keto-alpha-glucoside-1,2-lyase/3-keto-2-hydroxy-glucal hydratase domain-containing protein n=1 Tax=Sediminicola luteus TaxID=319238 RepID=A0A2A4GFI1_9FLAO|nr:family 16 glycoside hydrolase [Sediminicola luteus]PCE66716.1 hypothetical protein B7P33_05340 [Sediminicola luteus]